MTTIKNSTAIFQEGDKKNKNIVFVHGFPLDHQMWKLQVNFLKENYFCTSYDIRGLGKYGYTDGQLTIEMFVDDLFNLMDEAGLDKPVICGLSMGGYITLRALERDQSRFSSVILCDTKAEADDNVAKLKRAEAIKRINSGELKDYIEVLLPGLFAKKNLTTPDFEETIKISLAQNPLGVKGCLLAMAARTDTSGFLSQIKIPALVLCGEEDSITTKESMKIMSDKIPGAEFFVVPDAGHMSPLENPAFVNVKILNFLKGSA